jgi:hypothetical protein
LRGYTAFGVIELKTWNPYTLTFIFKVKPFLFNRGALLNVGFVEARSRADYDCYFFHDVDFLPLNDYNMYTCSTRPLHLGAFLKHRKYM